MHERLLQALMYFGVVYVHGFNHTKSIWDLIFHIGKETFKHKAEKSYSLGDFQIFDPHFNRDIRFRNP